MFIFFTAAIPAPRAAVNAQDEPMPLAARLEILETRLDQIEANQKKILQKQDAMIKQLDGLRIWVRRS